MRQKNKGFTLIEMVITVTIFAILLGILVPSLNSILGFRAQRAGNSIASALDKTKIEASNRLVGEMKLEKLDDGYYISYYLDRGKVGTESNVEQDQAEKIAPARTLIRRSNTLLTISAIFSSSSLPVPNVSTITETGFATPIA